MPRVPANRIKRELGQLDLRCQAQRQHAASLSLYYQAVEAERTLSINAYSISDDYTLDVLMEHWQSLVDKYRDMPMQVFTGAPVD